MKKIITTNSTGVLPIQDNERLQVIDFNLNFMTKIEVQQRVLQFGKPLDLELFSWDEKTLVFSTNQTNLVIDFSGISGCTFKTGSGCTFDTGSGCTFDTGSGCTFDTGSGCTFDTGSGCVCVRRDVFEFFEIPNDKIIKLNNFEILGYTVVDEVKELP